MTAAPSGAPARRRPLRRGAVWTPYLFLAPFLTVFGTFVAFPALRGLWMSLHDWDHLMPTRPFVGLANYTDLLDPASVLYQRFWDGMAATGIFVVASVPLLLTAPLLLAMALNRRFPGRTFLRAVVFLPYVLGVAVVAVLFRFVLDPNLGVLNHLLATTRLDRVLHALGAGDPVPWLTAQPWAWCRWSASRSGGRSGSTRLSTSPACRTSPRSSTTPRGWTARPRASGSGT